MGPVTSRTRGLGLLTSTLELAAEGEADPRTVWTRYAELQRWPEWSPQVSQVVADGGRLAPGLRGTVHGPVGVRVPFVVADVDERARRWSWQVRVGPVRLRLHHAVLPREGGGTRTTLVVHGPTALVVAYAPLARLALGRLVRP